jgi:hypothetical protein
MTFAKDPIKGLTGEEVHPWEYSVVFNHRDSPSKVNYKYSIVNNSLNSQVWEREPTRALEIMDPDSYRGELGNRSSHLWRNVN